MKSASLPAIRQERRFGQLSVNVMKDLFKSEEAAKGMRLRTGSPKPE